MKDLLRLMQTRVKEKQSRAVPDILSYSHVLAALSRAMNKDSAKRIVEIVETIEKEGKDGEHVAQIDSVGKFEARPDIRLHLWITFNKYPTLELSK